jgi:hypothetical protein
MSRSRPIALFPVPDRSDAGRSLVHLFGGYTKAPFTDAERAALALTEAATRLADPEIRAAVVRDEGASPPPDY